jgi:hypothetical protein
VQQRAEEEWESKGDIEDLCVQSSADVFFKRGITHHNEAGDHDIRPGILCRPAKAAICHQPREKEEKRTAAY